ncbi:hypothetical protein AB0P37_14815 [Streptomyces antimycoticus]|uniref:hypothetical protein n=1 Tax=Streptomyces antimycoticus TaxID=68175 RepID=UPI00343B5652
MEMDLGRMLETLRDRQLIPGGCQAALLVGSAARGWNNKKSDFDIYLISTESWSGQESIEVSVPLHPAGVQWQSFYADSHSWDLAYWLDDQVDQMLAKVSWDKFDQVRAASGDTLARREEVFLERLTTCVPLIGEDWVARRRAELEASAFRSIMVTRSLGAAHRAVEDALGQLEDGDLHSAVLSARIALGHTVDALLEERGPYISNPKWRARRFLATNPAALSFAQYWDLETMRDYDPDNPAKWINRVLALCQDLALKIES